MKPRWVHYCRNCIFLGTVAAAQVGVIIDCYYCQDCNEDGGWYRPVMGPVLIRRYNNAQHNISRWVIRHDGISPHPVWIDQLAVCCGLGLVDKCLTDQMIVGAS